MTRDARRCGDHALGAQSQSQRPSSGVRGLTDCDTDPSCRCQSPKNARGARSLDHGIIPTTLPPPKKGNSESAASTRHHLGPPKVCTEVGAYIAVSISRLWIARYVTALNIVRTLLAKSCRPSLFDHITLPNRIPRSRDQLEAPLGRTLVEICFPNESGAGQSMSWG
ncbi:hypothetical protein B0H16DRAFT_1516179 [Mycena metata]|uniref:Uncharacterized protein n=1 Tax=Mycena metata TaxID=1033252 RepID=A0AAD7NQC1_9AGAR|nr:hypothetical protein B0H16DRAFT_1516179 [Mycena metata]